MTGDWLRLAAWGWGILTAVCAIGVGVLAAAGNGWQAAGAGIGFVVAASGLFVTGQARLWRDEAREAADELDEWRGSDA
jgi:hypothetical protein